MPELFYFVQMPQSIACEVTVEMKAKQKRELKKSHDLNVISVLVFSVLFLASDA